MRALTLEVGFSCSSGPDGELLSDPVALSFEETIEVPMWVGSSTSFSGLSTVDFFRLPQGLLAWGCHGFRLRWSGRLVASGSAQPDSAQSFHSIFSLCHILAFFCAMRGGVPPCLPHSLRHFLASCLAVLPFASLPLVSRPWTVLCWSHLLSLSSVSGRLVVVPHQLVGLGGVSPLHPIALLLALVSSIPSGSLLRYRFKSPR